MAGLIPLLLTPATASRNSVMISSLPAQTLPAQQQQQHKPPRSAQPSRPKRMLKRFSEQPLGTLLVLPYTATDWKKTIVEIKRLHSARRFRQCSARCCEILDNIKDSVVVEPAYLIYLHFYAASSFEMTARPLLVTHAFRVKLLEQARYHYSAAASLIQTAEDSAIAKSRSSSSASSTFSRSNFGCHSPSGSMSSRAGTPSTEICSPSCSSSLFLPPGPPPSMTAPSPPVKKKVAFFMPVPAEPIIRPDSPTLGFDDLVTSEILYKELPPLPKQPSRTSILKQARPSIASLDMASYQHCPRQSSVSSLASSTGTLTTASLDSSSVSSAHPSINLSLDFSSTYRSLGRYCTHLDSLRTQVAFHIAAVDRELTTCTYSPTYDPSTLRPSSSLSVNRCTDGSRPVSRNSDRGRPSSRASTSSDGMPLEDLTARIERLREQGWKRKRFDPKRYEVLREAALEELVAD